MRIDWDIGLFPFGELDGAAALVLDIAEAEGDEITDEISRVRPNGASVVWIRRAPWGVVDFDRALHRAMTRHKEIFTAIRKVGSMAWSNLSIRWVVDMTDILRDEITAEQLFEKLHDPEVPRPDVYEAFAINPHRKNITDAHLRAISEIGAPVIFYGEDLGQSALPCVLRASSPFMLRRSSASLERDHAQIWKDE